MKIDAVGNAEFDGMIRVITVRRRSMIICIATDCVLRIIGWNTCAWTEMTRDMCAWIENDSPVCTALRAACSRL